MGIAEYISLKIGKKHIKKLIFTGGEPTILENFFDILDIIFKIRSDINLIIQTNGRAFSSADFTEKLEKYKTKNICFEVGLFSDKKEIHEKITRCKGSFEQTVKGIKNLLEKGYSVSINIVMNRWNFGDIGNIVGFAAQVFGRYKALSKINLIPPVPSGNYAINFRMDQTKIIVDAADKYIKDYKGNIPLELKNKY